MKFYFRPLLKKDDWLDCIYFDVETVSSFDEITDESLDIYNQAKHMAVAIAKKHKIEYDCDILKEYDDCIVYAFINRSPKELASILIDIAIKSKITNIVAHNGNHFDFIIFKHLDGVQFIENNDNYFMIVDNVEYRLVDTMKIANATGTPSLDNFSKTFTGIEKMKDGDFYEYMIHDAYILFKTCMRLNELGIQFTPTRTSRYHISSVIDKAVITTIDSEKLTAFDYAGGRTQVFQYLIDNQGYVYDFNSLYPSVMAYMVFTKLKEHQKAYFIDVEKANFDYLKYISKMLFNTIILPVLEKDFLTIREYIPSLLSDIFFTRVLIKQIKPEYREIVEVLSPLSFINRVGKRAYKIVENQEYRLSGYEIAFLEFFEYEVIECFYSKASLLPFSEMMKELYNQRQKLKKANDMRQHLFKIIMNASYGIFGLKSKTRQFSLTISTNDFLEMIENDSSLIIHDYSNDPVYAFIYDPTTNSFITAYQIAYDTVVVDVELADTTLFSNHSSPTIAILTTSHARFWLYLHMLHLKIHSFDIYYCDTDSIHTNAPPDFMKPFISDAMLDLKFEKSFSKAIYLAPKTYALFDNLSLIDIHLKGTGKELEKTFIQQSLKTPLKTITKTFLSPDTIPTFYPVENKAVYNSDYKRLKEFDEYMKLYSLFTELVS